MKKIIILFLIIPIFTSCSKMQNGKTYGSMPQEKDYTSKNKTTLSNMNYNSENWPEWIYERFGDSSRYEIEIDKDDKRIYTVRSVDSSIKSEICFLIMDLEDVDILYDIQFNGKDTSKNNTWCSPFTVDPAFEPNPNEQAKSNGLVLTSLYHTKEFINRLEAEWLSIPLKKGWTEEVYYVGKKIYKAKLQIGESENWDMSEKISHHLNIIDHLKILLHIDLSEEKFKFKPIDSE